MLLACLSAGISNAAESPAAREAVGKPVQAAQQMIKEGRLPDALAKLREADAVKGKTAYETYVIAETRAGAEAASGDYAAAIASLDTVLESGILPMAERPRRVQSQVQLAYQLRQFTRVVEYGERYYKNGGTDVMPRQLMAQAYYLSNDFANTTRTIRDLLRDGRPVGEPLLQALAASENQQRNEPGYRDALMRLVSAYSKPAYWKELLLTVRRAPEFAPRLTLDWFRLCLAAGAMDTPELYQEAAERALGAGLPAYARAFLDAGFASGNLGKGPQAERHRRLLDAATRQASQEAATLASLAKEAEAAGDGSAWAKLGEAHASHGQHDSAVTAFERAMAKAGLKEPEDVRLRLGVAWLGTANTAKANDVLSRVSGGDGAAELARLWLLRGAGG